MNDTLFQAVAQCRVQDIPALCTPKNLTQTNSDGQTALHLAVTQCFIPPDTTDPDVDLDLNLDPDPDPDPVSMQTRVEVVHRLLAGGADVDAQDDEGRSILHIDFCYYKDYDTIEFCPQVFQLLAEYSFNFDSVDSDGDTVLSYVFSALWHSPIKTNFVQALAQQPGLLVHVRNHRNYSVFDIIIKQLQFVHTEEWTIDDEASVEAVFCIRTVFTARYRTHDGSSVLHHVCDKHGLVEALVCQVGCDLEARDSKHRTPLMMVLEGGDLETADELLKHGADYRQVVLVDMGGDLKSVQALLKRHRDRHTAAIKIQYAARSRVRARAYTRTHSRQEEQCDMEVVKRRRVM